MLFRILKFMRGDILKLYDYVDVQCPALIATNAMKLGLGNRLRFTLSCQAIAEAEKRNFYYYWPVGKEFGARFDDLWKYQEKELNAPGPQPYLTQWSSSTIEITPYRDKPILSLIGSQVVKGFGNEESWESLFRNLKPVDEVSAAAERILNDIGGDFVGVQVRAAEQAHSQTHEVSPVSWFVKRMLQMHNEAKSDTRFFLSCDDPVAQSTILSSVPNVVALRKEGGYNTREGLIESVVDLLVLAKSNYLLGPYLSSFVYLARVLSNHSQDFETSRGVAKKKLISSDTLLENHKCT